MNHFDTFAAMLQSAGVSFEVKRHNDTDYTTVTVQNHNGGYLFYKSEWVFSAEAKLMSVSHSYE